MLGRLTLKTGAVGTFAVLGSTGLEDSRDVRLYASGSRDVESELLQLQVQSAGEGSTGFQHLSRLLFLLRLFRVLGLKARKASRRLRCVTTRTHLQGVQICIL